MESYASKFEGSNEGVIALHKSGTFNHNTADHRNAIDFDVELGNQSLSFTMSYADRYAKLSDLVPAARQLCNEIVDAAAQNETDQGQKIKCGKGCSNCCNYLVSLSSAEAFRINDEIFAMPVQKRHSFIHSMVNSTRHIINNTLPQELPGDEPSLASEEDRMLNISAWYGNLSLSCPFLIDRSCSIYDIRPLVCREHMVTTNPSACNFTSPAMPRIVDLPISIANVLMYTSDQLEGTMQEAVILPLTTFWTEENRDRAKRTWPAETLARTFIEIIQITASLNTSNSLPIIEQSQCSTQPSLEYAENNY